MSCLIVLSFAYKLRYATLGIRAAVAMVVGEAVARDVHAALEGLCGVPGDVDVGVG
jgi:ABC-type nickel/cobalt efflux system permease component RcnA